MCWDLVYFLISLVALIVFVYIYSSELFLDTVIVHFPGLLKKNNNGFKQEINTGGQIFITSLIVMSYSVVYLMLLNL